jgi:hypothetical protein
MSNETSDLRNVVQKMFKRAIAQSATQVGLKNSAELIERLRTGDCQRCETLRYNLARQMADYLSELDPDLRGLYLFDPDYACGDYEHPCQGESPAAGVNLIAWTRIKKSIPPEIVQRLRAAFLDARTNIACPDATGYCLHLNLAVVNDAQVRERRGDAALIDSTTVRPTQVWSKYRVAG